MPPHCVLNGLKVVEIPKIRLLEKVIHTVS